LEAIVQQSLLPVAIALAAAAGLIVVRGVTLRVCRGWAEKTENQIVAILVDSFRTPSLFWCLAIGIYAGVAVSDLPEKRALFFNRAIHAIVILSITIGAANLAGRLLGDYLSKSFLPVPATGLAHGILKGVILVLGFLFILSAVGISVTPIITALGVGGLAVALALQDTLANLFAGIYILAEKSLRIGDFIRLESGQEGYVADITWRTTRIRMIPNNMVVIPNSKITQSILTNYYLPEKWMAIQIPVRVSDSSEPEKVERILVEEAEGAGREIPGLLSDPAPYAHLIPGFGDGSLDFTLTCHVREFIDQNPVQHELRKRILRRFREEKIEFPELVRTVAIRKEKGGGSAPG
jgi:small-conductance mechanosensitive channel